MYLLSSYKGCESRTFGATQQRPNSGPSHFEKILVKSQNLAFSPQTPHSKRNINSAAISQLPYSICYSENRETNKKKGQKAKGKTEELGLFCFALCPGAPFKPSVG
jgi:hypothetical protein